MSRRRSTPSTAWCPSWPSAAAARCQGFGRVGEGLRVAAHAEDGTIEAVEDPSHRFALGVLWHPEAGEDLKLFEELVGAAADYRAAR